MSAKQPEPAEPSVELASLRPMGTAVEQVAYAPPPGEPEEAKFDFHRYLSAIYRYKWLVVATTIIGLVAGVILMRKQEPDFQAQATIWVEPGAGPGGPIGQGQLLQNTAWLDLLRSYAVLDSVVREQRLYISPGTASDTIALRDFSVRDRFRPGAYELRVSDDGQRFELWAENLGKIQEGQFGDSVGTELGFVWVPQQAMYRARQSLEFSVTTPRQAALAVSQKLDARMPPQFGNLIRLQHTGKIPTVTAATLNSVADQFVRVAADLKREKLTELTRILAQQLDAAATELRTAETDLERFRVRTITEPSESQQPVVTSGLQATQASAMSNFFQMRNDADIMKQDREAIERALRLPADSGISALMLEAIPTVRASPELMAGINELTTKRAALRALQTRYTESNPAVVRIQDEVNTLERRTIPAALNALLVEVRSREAQLNGRIEAATRDLRQIPVRSIEESRLTRRVTIANSLYTSLQANFAQAQLAEASSIPDVRVLDAAVVPDRPLEAKGKILVLLGLAGGLGAGIALCILLDKLDSRLRYPDQVTRELGLTILGVVPRVSSNGKGLRSDDAAQVVESLRTIRLNLVNAYGSAGPLVTTISSPGSGDGKSFLASNLALSFADAGHRTMLIDGDIRRGALHRVLSVQRKPGLLDYLGGQATREQVIQKTRIPSVDFIGCGTRKMGGPELLASPAMSQLVLSLRSQYSVIIIDSAPLGAGVDPLVLGSLTGSLLLVLRTGVTDRELATAKLEDLDRLPIRVLGAVLNDVKATGVYKYYSYIPGYSSEDEEPGTGSAAGVPTLPAGATDG